MLHANKDDDGEIQDVEGADAFVHLMCIGWKLLFAFTPPPHILGGWACFVGSLSFIGVVTFVVGEFANLFGCVLDIKPSITAITFVALGTSLPDTFASMAAAQAEKYADSAVGNVTGSNSVNVFLGLGLPWVIATAWSANFTPAKGKIPWDDLSNLKYYARFGADSPAITDDTLLPLYYVPAGSLGFSVVIFCCCAVTCIIFLMIRRKVVGGELGGSSSGRLGSCIFLVSLWFIYVIMSIL
jgi:solute carrier family 8 (sodium/calcium exchanger)